MFSNNREHNEDDHAPLLVIGAGICRTGTLTLKTALEILYQKPCYHMMEIVYKHLDHVQLWTQVYDRVEQDIDAELPPDLIKQIFKGYQMTTDIPGCVIYKQLMKIYPEAKVRLFHCVFHLSLV
ncbi:unnamed protein product [Echinostoma caproni]|uniref:Protein-tyrosine sulfotransferase n=1 Tax=Echinostoma caproni TaxID=27848 RepID=A0A183BGE8_9TREM|nr:unnamed protein product [Echinostoma caproni]